MPKPDELKDTRVPSGARPAAKKAGQTSSTLLVAAQALAEASPTAGTVQDVLEGRVLGHYAQGLKQYLAIRLGSPDDARGTFAKLKDSVAGLGMDKLAQPPGIRARLYRMARALADKEESRSAPTGTLLWMKPTRASLAQPMTLIRDAPRQGDRELLELRFARELDTKEIAFVLDLEPTEVEQRIARAKDEARELFAAGGDINLPRVLLEAFALEKIDEEVQGPQGEPMLPLGTILEGRYELKKHIGSGAFADVFKAVDVAIPDHVVALKVLKRKSSTKRAKDQALRELRLIASVFHPSIVQFKDHGWYEERFWFAMPWYQGEALEQRIDRLPLGRHEAKRIFVPLARALATMHAAGLRHQDIKPDNILLAELKGSGEDKELLPVLLDLGVAAKDAELVLAGTPTYFAPEVAAQFSYQQGDPFPVHPIGPATDVFSLALCLRNALEPSTQPDVAAGAVDAFIRERSRRVPDLASSKDLRFLDKHFKRWMALDPADRPTADELADELTVLTAPEERRERRMRILRVVVPIAAVLLTLIGLGAYQLTEEARVHAEKAEAAESGRQQALEDLDEATATREQLESQINTAQDRINSSRLSREELTEQFAQAEGRLAVLRRSVSRLRREKRQLDKETGSLRSELASTQEALTGANARVQTLRGDLATSNEQRASARTRANELSARVATLETELRTAEQAQGAATRRAVQAEEQRAALTRERDTARTAAQAAERRATQAEAELERAQARLATAEAANRDLRRQLRARPTPTPLPTPMLPTPDPDPPTVMVRRR